MSLPSTATKSNSSRSAVGTVKSRCIRAMVCPSLSYASLLRTTANKVIMASAVECHNSSHFVFTTSICSLDAQCKQPLPSSLRRRFLKVRAHTFPSLTSAVKFYATLLRKTESTGSRNPLWKVSRILSGGCMGRSIANRRQKGPSRCRRIIGHISS